jgi:hypothetical protein
MLQHINVVADGLNQVLEHAAAQPVEQPPEKRPE